MVLGLLVGEPALAAQLLDQRVVGGQQLAARRRARRRRGCRRRGRCEISSPSTSAAVSVVPIPEREESCWASSWIRAFAVLGDRGAGRPRAPRRLRSAGSNASAAILRGDLARLGAAHAVGDREQRRAGEVGVLVGGPLAARVGTGRPARRRAAIIGRHSGTSSSKRNSVSPIRISSRSRELRLAVELLAVEEGAVGRAHVLDVVGAPRRVDARVDPRREAVLDPHVGVGRAADREAAEEVEALARRRGRRRARRPARRRSPARGRRAADLVEAGRLGRRARSSARSSAARCARPRAGTGRARRGSRTSAPTAIGSVSIVSSAGLTCSMSKVKRVVPSATSSPGDRREESTWRPLTLTPLVEPRSTICQSPVAPAPQLGVAAGDVRVVEHAVALLRAAERRDRPVEDVAAVVERDDRPRLGQVRRRRALARLLLPSAARCRPSCGPARPATAPRPARAGGLTSRVWIPNSPRRSRSSVSSSTSGRVSSA